MDVNSLVQTVAIYAFPVLFAITLHEAAHGYVARHFGDMTAHAERRISLNLLPKTPAAHYARFEQWSSHLPTAVVLFAVFDGMANDGKLMARGFAPLGNLAHLLVRAIVYG